MGHISSILAGAKIGVQNGREILGRAVDSNYQQKSMGSAVPGDGRMMGGNDSRFGNSTIGGRIPLYSDGDSISGSGRIGNGSSSRTDVLGYDVSGNANISLGRDGFRGNIENEGSLFIFRQNGARDFGNGSIEGSVMNGLTGSTNSYITANPSDGSYGGGVNAELFAGPQVNGGYTSDNISADATGRLGVIANGGGSINLNPSTGNANGEFHSSVLFGGQAGFNGSVNNSLVSAEVSGTLNMGPQIGITTGWDYTDGNLNLAPRLNRFGLVSMQDTSADIVFHPDGFRELGERMYDGVNDFVDSRFPNDYHDPYTEQLGFENDSYLMDDIIVNESSLEDQMIMDSLNSQPTEIPPAPQIDSAPLPDGSLISGPVSTNSTITLDSSTSILGGGSSFEDSSFGSGIGSTGYSGGNFGSSSLGGSNSGSFFNTGGFDGGSFGSSWGGLGGGGNSTIKPK